MKEVEDDGQVGSCRACGIRRPTESVTICTDCVHWTLVRAARVETVTEALEIIKMMLLE